MKILMGTKNPGKIEGAKQAFEKYDVKLLKNAANQMIEEFRSQWGFETKAMLKESRKN